MTPRTGLFGKLPRHGDFVRRNLPRSFVGPWDAWLSAGLLAAPKERWGPWRFHLAAGDCGPDAAAGVLAASEDAVGRRFPLTLAALGVSLRPPEAWYAALEALATDAALDADALAVALPEPPEAPAIPELDATMRLRREAARGLGPDAVPRGELGGWRGASPTGHPDGAGRGLAGKLFDGPWTGTTDGLPGRGPQGQLGHAPDDTLLGASDGPPSGTSNGRPDSGPCSQPGLAPDGTTPLTRSLLWTADGRMACLEAGFAAVLAG